MNRRFNNILFWRIGADGHAHRCGWGRRSGGTWRSIEEQTEDFKKSVKKRFSKKAANFGWSGAKVLNLVDLEKCLKMRHFSLS